MGIEQQDHQSTILVAYFSGTGHTQRVADTIAQTLGADLFPITPQHLYSHADLDWTDPSSRCSREHVNEQLQTIALVDPLPQHWASYDTVIVCYPIWWARCCWVVQSWVRTLTFSGKQVFPVCTSYSSGVGSTARRLAASADGGLWHEGTNFGEHDPVSSISSWAKMVETQAR